MECDETMVISTDDGFKVQADLYQDEDGFREAERSEICDVKKGDVLMMDSIHYCVEYEFTVVLFKCYIGDTPASRPHYQRPEITMFEMEKMLRHGLLERT